MFYAYLNDFSMHLPDGQTLTAWPLLNEVMEISSVLKNDYEIEFIKVPNDFKNTKIANSHSIKELLDLPEGEFETEKQQLIYDFLGNRIMSEKDEVEMELLKEFDKGKWIEVKYNGQYSIGLTGAHLLQTAAVSFSTQECFKKDHLPCEYSIELVNKVKSTPVEIKNIYGKQQLVNHHAHLIRIKNDITFGRGQWNPYENPIWNNKTEALIQELEFPQSVIGKKSKISELKEVGEKIAILNCWTLDRNMTRINSNSGQIRMVFISNSTHKHAYLSIDVKNAYGRFEHHDDKGRHTGEIEFATGNYVPRGKSETGKDKDGNHDLKLKR